MSSTGSVTRWLGALKAGDGGAAEKLWQRYFEQMVRLARGKIRGARRRAADEEDVALSAFDSFCRGARQGRFPRLRDRTSLWPLLVVITARKAADLIQHERRKKRGGGRVRGESALDRPGGPAGADAGIEQVVGVEPSPEFTAQVEEEYRRLLDRLADPQLRAVAVWKLEGYTNAEIAAKLGCVPGTVERKLRVIRSTWAPEGAADGP
jgi:DNA-directed RNA polymerase specialized sigma24 family protein